VGAAAGESPRRRMPRTISSYSKSVDSTLMAQKSEIYLFKKGATSRERLLCGRLIGGEQLQKIWWMSKFMLDARRGSNGTNDVQNTCVHIYIHIH